MAAGSFVPAGTLAQERFGPLPCLAMVTTDMNPRVLAPSSKFLAGASVSLGQASTRIPSQKMGVNAALVISLSFRKALAVEGRLSCTFQSHLYIQPFNA